MQYQDFSPLVCNVRLRKQGWELDIYFPLKSQLDVMCAVNPFFSSHAGGNHLSFTKYQVYAIAFAALPCHRPIAKRQTKGTFSLNTMAISDTYHEGRLADIA